MAFNSFSEKRTHVSKKWTKSEIRWGWGVEVLLQQSVDSLWKRIPPEFANQLPAGKKIVRKVTKNWDGADEKKEKRKRAKWRRDWEKSRIKWWLKFEELTAAEVQPLSDEALLKSETPSLGSLVVSFQTKAKREPPSSVIPLSPR